MLPGDPTAAVYVTFVAADGEQLCMGPFGIVQVLEWELRADGKTLAEWAVQDGGPARRDMREEGWAVAHPDADRVFGYADVGTTRQ